MERLDTDLLFRWFVGLAIDDPVWDATVFSKNRDRLLDGAIAAKFLAAVLAQPRVKRLISSDHFSVDGTLIEAWASMKKLQAEGRFRGSAAVRSWPATPRRISKGEKRSNETHASTTDPEARLYRKGPGMEAKARFPRPRLDGEPLRSHRRRLSDARQRPWRTHRGAGHDRAARRSAKSHHARRRQGL